MTAPPQPEDRGILKEGFQPGSSESTSCGSQLHSSEGWVGYSDDLDLVGRLVDFARLLRSHGIKCSPAELIEAFQAVKLLDVRSLEDLRAVLKLTLAKRVEDYEVFDSLFNSFWAFKYLDLPKPRASVRVIIEGELDAVSRFLSVYSPLEVMWRDVYKPATSPFRSRSIGRTLRAYRRILSLQYGRRRVRNTTGFIDFRRSMKASLRTFGELVKLVRSRRKKSKAKLAVLLDVSGSMRDHWGLIVDVLRALRNLPSGSYKAFIFSTRLVDVTSLISLTEGFEDIVGNILKEFSIWGSGTRIGEALRRLLEAMRFNKSWCLIIVSDGWDLGDLSVLEESLRALKSIAGHMVWVTPYRSERGFKPETACLRIALRYVDKLLPPTSLESPRILKMYYRR